MNDTVQQLADLGTRLGNEAYHQRASTESLSKQLDQLRAQVLQLELRMDRQEGRFTKLKKAVWSS